MHLCHRVLSRSQMNAILKLREAGIVINNLVTLPNLSNISLANNGIHISLGSQKLSCLLADPSSGFTNAHEKYLGDLVVKIVEHFLPLFVGTYSAAPYRLDFTDFHPEKALGFLPHELDYTHLRMIWRRWKKKANLNIFGNPITPFGPVWLDHVIHALFNLKGDFVLDFRLIDYLVALMSTKKSPALDGSLGNHERLKKDLSDMGVFDTKMSLYLFDKLRSYADMGFSGFEGRYYSLFYSFDKDMRYAVELQNLIYLLAFKYIAAGQIGHEHIPDDPFVESERRQIVFGTAIGIPTFFVCLDTGNALMKHIMERTHGVRRSRRYPGYLRVYNLEYRKALGRILRDDASDLIEVLGAGDILEDLKNRLETPEFYSAFGKLTSGILGEAGVSSPVAVIALLVEKQANTSTIGGASFIGIIVAPCVVLLVNETLGVWMHFRVNLLVIYTAMSIAYTMGEGIGRLACISFGCCYGKPLAQCNPMLRRIFERRYFVFSGRTKKISYAHHLDGEKVIPVQALTCVLYTVSGLLGCYIFLKGFLLTAMLISLTVTCGWRFISEFLRADNRGGGHISAYQIMALIVMAYTFLLAEFLPLHTPIKPNLAVGLWFLWNPFVIFFIECLGIIIFLVTGRSQVTGSTINLFVVRENIHQ